MRRSIESLRLSHGPRCRTPILPREIARRFLRADSFGAHKSRLSENTRASEHTRLTDNTELSENTRSHSDRERAIKNLPPVIGMAFRATVKRRHLLVIILLVNGSSGLEWLSLQPAARDAVRRGGEASRQYEKAASHEAIEKYRDGDQCWERQGQRRRAARAWQRVAAAYEQLGSLEESLGAYEAALSLRRGSRTAFSRAKSGARLGLPRQTLQPTRACRRSAKPVRASASSGQSAGGARETAQGSGLPRRGRLFPAGPRTRAGVLS